MTGRSPRDKRLYDNFFKYDLNRCLDSVCLHFSSTLVCCTRKRVVAVDTATDVLVSRCIPFRPIADKHVRRNQLRDTMRMFSQRVLQNGRVEVSFERNRRQKTSVGPYDIVPCHCRSQALPGNRCFRIIPPGAPPGTGRRRVIWLPGFYYCRGSDDDSSIWAYDLLFANFSGPV